MGAFDFLLSFGKPLRQPIRSFGRTAISTSQSFVNSQKGSFKEINTTSKFLKQVKKKWDIQ